MKLSKYQLIIIAVVLVIVVFVVLALLGVFSKDDVSQNPYLPTSKITLSLWGYDISSVAMNDIISAYQKSEPLAENVKITYQEFSDKDAYEQELLQALAEGRGPDIFMIQSPNTYQKAPTLYPAPETFISPQTFLEYFPQVVFDDGVFLSGDTSAVYMSPLSLDVLSLIYNKDIFDGAGIAFPPTTWEEVVTISNRLKETGSQGEVLRAGISLGGVDNVSYLDSLLYALFFQNKSQFFDQVKREVRFDDQSRQAIEFYTQFSNPLHPYYTWNESMKQDIEAFSDGSVAMIIGTLNSLKDIQEKNPFLRVGVSPLPQVTSDPASFRTTGVYTFLGVSKQTAYPATAWHVVRALTMTALNDLYREKTDTYPALRQRIDTYSGAYKNVVTSFLGARSWHTPAQGNMLPILKQLLIDIRERGLDTNRALKAAEEKINALFR